jgi:hypothetical protein
MNQSLTSFKEEFRNRLLDFLWRQWSALGVAGHEREYENESWIIDPEALLLFTCTLGRHDPRLFDEGLDWLGENGRFINVMRLKRILATEEFAGQRTLAAIATCLMKGAEAAKWKRLSESAGKPAPAEAFFIGSDGAPLPVVGELEPNFARHGFRRGPLRLRGHSQLFQPLRPASLILQLRALLGVNIRCEIVAYLLTHEAAHPSQIARDAFFFERAAQAALVDMLQSGVVQVRLSRREKHYWLIQRPWAVLLNRPEPFPQWVTWAPFFSSLEQIWLKINDRRLESLDPLLLSSELRQLMVVVRPAIERSRFDKSLSDDRQYLGEKYLPVFYADVLNLLS